MGSSSGHAENVRTTNKISINLSFVSSKKKKKKKRGGKIYTELDKKGLNDLDNHDSVHSPRARHPGV